MSGGGGGVSAFPFLPLIFIIPIIIQRGFILDASRCLAASERSPRSEL